jgi:hypothetical protein
MSRDTLILIELLLVFGLVLWFVVSQLRSLKKLEQESREKDRTEDETRDE